MGLTSFELCSEFLALNTYVDLCLYIDPFLFENFGHNAKD